MSIRVSAIAFALLALSAVEAQAAAPLQLDLKCSGVKGSQLHFRVDLAQKRWCFGECRSVWSINELSDTVLKVLTYGSHSSQNWTFSIDRYTSTFTAVHRGYGDEPADRGHCKVQPFSGFPARQF
jgi:hypothetical protein